MLISFNVCRLSLSDRDAKWPLAFFNLLCLNCNDGQTGIEQGTGGNSTYQEKLYQASKKDTTPFLRCFQFCDSNSHEHSLTVEHVLRHGCRLAHGHEKERNESSSGNHKSNRDHRARRDGVGGKRRRNCFLGRPRCMCKSEKPPHCHRLRAQTTLVPRCCCGELHSRTAPAKFISFE